MQPRRQSTLSVHRFCALPAAIDLIVAFEWGTNVSPEGLAQGYTHCFQLTFANEADRDAYLVHPAHREFVEMPKPGIEQTLVFDYWSS